MTNDHAKRGIRNHAKRGSNPAKLDDKIPRPVGAGQFSIFNN